MGSGNSTKRSRREENYHSNVQTNFTIINPEEHNRTEQTVGSNDTLLLNARTLDERETNVGKGKKNKKKKQKDNVSNIKNKAKIKDSKERIEAKVSHSGSAAVQGSNVGQKADVQQSTSLYEQSTGVQQSTANQKTREDQLNAKNEKLLQQLKDFERLKKTEIEKLEQRLKDLANENDKAVAKQKEKIQVLQKEKDDLARGKPKEETEQNDKQFEQLKEQLQQKDDEIKQLKQNNKELEEELKETHERYDKTTSGKREKKETAKHLENELKLANKNMQKKLENFEKEKKTEIQKLEERLNDLAKQRDMSLAKMEGEKRVLLKEKEDLLLRLSEMAGSRLTDNNPNITDLSDENRPTKLAEKYTELYDNEWTDAFTYLQTFEVFKNSEKHTIYTMVKILEEAFTISTRTAQGKLETLRKVLDDFYRDIPSKNGQVRDIMKQLKDQRKKITSPSQELVKNYKDAISKGLPTTLSNTILSADTFKPYLQKCLEICWLMAVQDPPLHLTLENCKNGHKYDKNIFKEYTKSGPFIDFLVWPAVFLEKDGAVLCKGVVQCKKSNSFRSSSNYDPQIKSKERKSKSMYNKQTSTPFSSTIIHVDVEGKKTSTIVVATDKSSTLTYL